MRTHDPALARELLANAWASEKADARLRLLAACSQHVAAEDESFLERALADRSKEVRSLAADLLARLPGARYAEWVWQTAREMVRYTPQLGEGKVSQKKSNREGREPLGAGAGRLEILLPTEFDADWARRGLVEQAPAAVSKRAYWFWQIVKRVPPVRWQEQCRAEPAELVAAAARSEDMEVVLAAWSEAAMAHAAAEWYGPLWDGWMEWPALHQFSFWSEIAWQFMTHAVAAGVLPQIPARMKRLLAKEPDGDQFCSILECLSRPWDEETSSVFFSEIVEQVEQAQKKETWQVSHWFDALELAARRMHPSKLGLAAQWANSVRDRYWLVSYPKFVSFDEIVRLRTEVVRRFSRTRE